MRHVFLASFAANILLALVSFAILPDRVAIHFGPGGLPNGWASNLSSTLLMLGTHLLVFLSLFLSPRLLTTSAKKWVSLPNREYWLRPENRPRAVTMFSQRLWQFGTALFLFMLLAGLLTLQANLSDPVVLDERLFLTGLVIFLVYTGYWTVALLRAFRAPGKT
jgi:hypothetical protein